MKKSSVIFWFFGPAISAIIPLVHAIGEQGISPISTASMQLAGIILIASALCSGVLLKVSTLVPARWSGSFLFTCIVMLLLFVFETGGYFDALRAFFQTFGVSALSALIFAIVMSLLLTIPIAILGQANRIAGQYSFGVLLLVMLGGTVLNFWDSWHVADFGIKANLDASKPAVVHIVLDEMIGPEGLPSEIAGADELKLELYSIFSRHGFKVYSHAFSRHFMTAKSIPNLLNYDGQDNTFGTVSAYQRADDFRIVQSNRHFERMVNQGYAISVFQSHFMNFCRATVVESCKTFPSYAPESEFLESSFSNGFATLAAQLLAIASNKSRLRRYFFDAVGGNNIPPVAGNPIRFDLYGIQNWTDFVRRSIVKHPRGVYSFVHLLAPHGPYILSGDCKPVKPWGQLPQFIKEEKLLSGEAFRIEREIQYQMYFKQTSCVLGIVDKMLKAILADPEMRDATIIVHGDHGSRISSGRYLESLTERDLVDNYSTLFAIRRPGMHASVDNRLVSIHHLFAEQFLGENQNNIIAKPDVATENFTSKSVVPKSMTPF